MTKPKDKSGGGNKPPMPATPVKPVRGFGMDGMPPDLRQPKGK